nr:DUF4439 domain-containing protein [Arthrobacter sp. zg-Y769]
MGAVVLSFGLVADTGDASDRGRTFSGIALAQARDGALNLAAEARVLADAGKNPEAAEFLAQAEGLRTQAALLTGTGREPSASRRSFEEPFDVAGTAGSDRAGSSGASGASGNPEHYVQTLAASARTNLRSAWRADAGTARLLAATGAAQQVWAVRAAGLYDLPVPETIAPGAGNPAPGTSPTGGPGTDQTPPACPDAGTGEKAAEPETGTETSSGDTAVSDAAGTDAAAPDAAAALKAAIDAEFGAAYAYEVALAQDPPAADLGEQWRRRGAEHESRGTDAVAYLPDLCLPAVAPVAAYRLDAGFLRDPSGALPALEQQFPAVYADLVALSEGDLRGWAISRLAAVSGELYLEADTVPATPGLAAVPDDLPWN